MALLTFFLFFIPALFADIGIEDHALVLDSYEFEKKDKLPLAIERMKKVLQTESDNYFVHLRLGKLYLKSNDVIKATTYFTKAGELKLKSIEPWLILAEHYKSANDDVKEKAFAYEVLKRNPYHKEAGVIHAEACEKLKTFADGLDRVKESLEAYPTDEFFMEKRTSFLFKLARREEARKSLAELLLINPENSYARSEMKSER